MTQLEIVQNHINKTPSIIFSRGKDLFSRLKISLTRVDEGNTYHFKVKGNQVAHYAVVVSMYEKTLSNECECPYNRNGDVCKHIAASYLFLEEYLEEQALKVREQEATEQFTQPLMVSFEEGVKDKKELFVAHKSKLTQHLVAENIVCKPGSITAELLEPWEVGHHLPTKMKVARVEGGYHMQCDDHSHKGDCNHLQWMIDFLGTRFRSDLFEWLEPNGFEEKVKAHLLKIGTSLGENEKPEDLVDVQVVGGEIRFFPKDRLQGLIAPDRLSRFLKDQVLGAIATQEMKEQLFLPNVSNKTQSSEMPAFVWMIEEYDLKLSKLLCISGKPTKTLKLGSSISEVYSPYEERLIPTDNFDTAFFQHERINLLVNEETGDTKNVPNHALFNALNNFINLTKDQVHYFFTENPYGGSYSNLRKLSVVPKKSDMKPVVSIMSGLKLKFKFYKEDPLYALEAHLETSSGEQYALSAQNHINLGSGILLIGEEMIASLSSMKEAYVYEHFYKNPVFRATPEGYQEFVEEVVMPIANEFTVAFDEQTQPTVLTMKPQQKRIYISELNQFVIFKPVMRYEDGHEVNVLEDTTLIGKTEKGFVEYERDSLVEKAFLEDMAALHTSWKSNTHQSFFFLTYDEMQKGHWFLKAFESMRYQDVHIFGLNDLKKLKFSPHKPAISMAFSSGQDWFETNINIAFGDTKVTVKQLRKAVQEGSGYIELADGTYGIMPEEWMEKFGKLFRTAEADKDQVRISKTQFNMLDDLIDESFSPEVFQEIAEKKRRLAEFSGISVAQKPAILQAQLRDYQQSGLNWLNFLREYGWGGILADDMGLGKTLQALALICLELENNPDAPSLVIAPTTLLFNWKNEIEKFAPGIDYIIHHGERYDNPKELSKHQLVLTSYGVVVNDVEILKSIPFNLIIADESQAIKNLNSKRNKAISKLKAKVRIAMSGTPIENNIYELYAQMNFANPGFFQGLTSFKDNYASLIDSQDGEKAIDELRKKTRPFILRRTKEQVLKELPDKTEEYLYCEMGAAQRKVYDAFRNEYRNYLIKKFDTEGVEKSQMYVLEGLMRLRQVCDSPQLIEKEGLNETASTKMDELVSHVLEKTGKHKILVFSQFVKMLQLVKTKFDALHISYEYLDGKTSMKERERRVNHFQENEDCRVFLISLKAGGTGLNLTSADYVYILDPWWNPAVENQAIDRCYRMGQQKKVFAYRMICKDTVEEKIVEMQKRKKLLSDDVVGAGDGVMKSLSRADIEDLFS